MLVVDDEAEIAELMRAMLEGAGFGTMRTQPPERGLGRDLRALQPDGPGAARWRALQGEITGVIKSSW